MKDPLLSILIPTRNRAKYLKYAIQSAINIASPSIEIIVSENYGADDGWHVANSFLDPRLTVLRPPSALPMHAHFEFLLSKASGKWITFVGDDDALMAHCVDYLAYLDFRYPDAEAIVSPRAYYYWKHAYSPSEDSRCRFNFSHHEIWRDSKKELARCLKGEINYPSLPQLYSGGFHRRSLVQRVIRLQGGHYFRSVTPDAYSAVMATLHTYRYLEVGVPMTWVGSSPSSSVAASAKSREKDFFGMHTDSFSMNFSLGKEWHTWPLIMHFFEAYISAVPYVDCTALSWDHIRRIYRLAAKQLILCGKECAATELALSLGVVPLRPDFVVASARIERPLRRAILILAKLQKALQKRLFSNKIPFAGGSKIDFRFEYASFGDDCEDILASDCVVKRVFREYRSIYLADLAN